MSARTESEASGPSASRAAPAGETGAPRNVPGWLLGRVSVLPALVAMAWLLAGLPLLLAGRFAPVLMLVIWVPLAAVLVVFGLRWIPDRWQDTLPAPGPDRMRTPWWALAGVVLVAVAFGIEQMIYHSQQIIVSRDPASYVQFGAWIAQHGSLPIPQARAAFSGTHQLLQFQSAGFYQVGRAVVPQFMAGLPMVLAAGFWIGGVGAAVAVAPLLGACAVLTFGGLAARLAGPRWAPLAALVLALSMPEQFTSRSTFSEPLAQILFLGGLCLVIDSLESGKAGARVTAGLGGLAFGLTMLVRIDGASDILPVILYCALLLIGRRPQAVPLFGGLVAGALFGGVDGLVLSRPYLASLRGVLIPLALAAGITLIVAAAAVALRWKRGLPRVRRQWLPNAAAVLAFAVMIGFTIRPYLETVRGSQAIVTAYQRADHLPLDPRRLYSEISLHWVFWYIGVPAVVLGTLGAALLARRCLQGRARAWVLPLMTFGWTIVTILYRPSIVPDHPWASRRLVPAVLPGFILLAVWASGWLLGWLRRMHFGRVARGGLVVGLRGSPRAADGDGLVRPGDRLKAARSASEASRTAWRSRPPTQARSPRSTGCARRYRATRRLSSSTFGRRRFTQVVRGMCGVPAASLSPRRRRCQQVGLGHRAGRAHAGAHGVECRAARALRWHDQGDHGADNQTRCAHADGSPAAYLPAHDGIWISEPTRAVFLQLNRCRAPENTGILCPRECDIPAEPVCLDCPALL